MTIVREHHAAQAINAVARARLMQDGHLPDQKEHSMNEMVEVTDERAPMTVAEVLSQVQRIQQVMSAVMKENVHYGQIPGTNAKSLWKPGAELLAATFRIAPHYEIEDLSSSDDEVRYRVKCIGVHQVTGLKLGEGMGEASSNEEKYKWKRAGRTEFDKTLPDRRRVKYGYNKQERKEFEIQQVRAEPADIANTVLKMACKRAQIAMTLTVLAAGDCFAQDLEDLPDEVREQAGSSDEPPAREVRQPEAQKSTVDKSTGEVKSAGKDHMTTTQIKLLRMKMEEFKVGEEEIEAQFGVGLDNLPIAMFNEVQAFVIGESKST